MHHLQFFVAVAETGSFCAASRREGVSQPTISEAVARLEAYFGSQLLNRDFRDKTITANLTSKGETVIIYAKEIVEATRSLVDLMKSITKKPPPSPVVYADLGSFAEYLSDKTHGE
jgi:LysR family nitrogen assimilation transcriptional regulator